ncbi:DUF998 domain-containing protein [Actinacidiphila acidipaludis]|uniref:DUF998 domain-containing protein n=1 Tax=Actinacidiphila acidipaludis TaxID=2873382 RepID=A0ABS7QG99_9ACTN|nr:DUF998 domain-containing protein [Streptomyces acidipaludis]MBY8882203.1 DUF998 domain-containing protein [Streptomyces acidipaludis]
MGRVTWWAVLSSACAPAVLVGGSMTAAALQGPTYDPVTETISVLAAGGRSEYWALTTMLVVLGMCYLTTAFGLRAAAPLGRVALGAGGVAAIVLALFPAPKSGGSFPHGSVVTVGFSLLAVWPVLACFRGAGAARGTSVPWALRPVPSITATAVIVVGAAWFLVELELNGPAGIAERVLTALQSLWPAVVVVSCLLHPRRI